MREELIASAINFLQDPSVAASPVEKRVAFLQSKNLTNEEITEALRRVGEGPPPPSAMVQRAPVYPPGPPPPYYAPAQQPPSATGRDWRDWFIMATVTGGVGYGLYFLTKRYVYPLIAPPTPPQLESDKASIDRKFDEAFSLLETLKTDTAALKAAEEERKAHVDAALAEVESVVQSLKDAGKRREDESKRVGDEVRSLRDLIPKALEGQKDQQKKALEDLQAELQSLKSLVINRTAAARPNYVPSAMTGTPPLDPGAGSAAPAVSGVGTGGNALGGLARKDAPMGSSLPFGVGAPGGGKPAIPAWQMAQARANSTPPTAAAGSGSAANAGKQPTVSSPPATPANGETSEGSK